MISAATLYRFGQFVVDTARHELRHEGDLRHVEPQVFDLIRYLIENSERIVTRDELVGANWGGRVISDSALSSRISSARRALNDNGRNQHTIKTVPRRGFRFVGGVEIDVGSVSLDDEMTRSLSHGFVTQPQEEALRKMDAKPGATQSRSTTAGSENAAKTPGDPPERKALRRPSLFIAAFQAGSGDRPAATGLTRDVTNGFARLRSLFVIAPATALALQDNGVGPLEAARRLGADYCVLGSLARDQSQIRVDLELVAPQSGKLLWVVDHSFSAKEVHEAPSAMADLVVAGLAAEIELAECHRASLRPAASLGAWEAHHRGLWHLHHFTRDENEKAIACFKRAASLDPTLSRAYAALSYAHWMNAFAFRPSDKDLERDRALDAAGRGLHADPKDPAALWSMSRALWMKNDEVASLRTIDCAISLCPSFALAHHARSFVECQTGDAALAIEGSRVAQSLSPYDPWKYAMHGVEAFSFLRLGRYDEAAEAARHLTSKPNAHIQARGLAALVLGLFGATDEARCEVNVIREVQPGYSFDDFLAAYHVPGDLERDLRRSAKQIGID